MRTHPSLRGWLILVALAAQLSCLTACHNPYKDGLEALQAGQLDQAEREARGGLKEDPRDPELHFLLAQVLVRREAWTEARDHAARAARGLPERASAQLLHARVQDELGATIEAAEHYLKARALKPQALQGFEERLTRLLPRAITAARDNDLPEQAIAFIELLRELDPKAPSASQEALLDAQQAKGQKLARQGQWSQAAQWYGELARLYPDKPEFLLEQGILYLSLEKDQEAQAALDAWLQQTPADQKAQALAEVGRRARIRGRLQIAERYWEQAVVADPGLRSAHLELASLRYQSGREEEAWESLQASLAGQPDPTDYLRAAQTAQDSRRGEVAVEVLELGNQKATPDFRLTRRLAEMLLRRQRSGDMEAALDQFVERSAQGQGGQQARADALLEVATWLEGQKDLEAAARYLEQALALPQAPPAAWLQLASLQGQRGRRTDMSAALERYLQASSKQEADYATAATLLMNNRLYEEAQKLLLEGLRQHKDSDRLTRALALAYRDGGYPERELALWRDWASRQPKPAAASLEVGRQYLERTLYAEAISFFQAATKDKEQAAQAWLLLGKTQLERGQDAQATEAFENYLKQAPSRREALPILLELYKRSDNPNAAIAVLQELIQLEPQEPEHLYALARLYRDLGDTEKAMEQLRLFIQRSGAPTQAARRAGRLFSNQPGRALTLELYDELLRHHGDKEEIYAELGDMYWQLARDNDISPERRAALQELARRSYARFLQKHQPSQESRRARQLRSLGRELNAHEMWRLSLQAFERAQALGLKLNADEQLERGRALLYLGQKKEARQAFTEHLAASQDKPSRYFKLGELAIAAGAYGMGLDFLQQVFDQNVQGDVTRAFELASRVLIRTGQKDRIPALAVRTLELTRAPFGVRLLVASTFMEAGMWEEAIEEYRDLSRLRPGDPDMIRRLAEAQFLSGDSKQASRLFAEAAQSSSDPASAWETIGAFYAERGQIQPAVEALGKALEAKGGNRGDVLVRRGLLLALRGDWEAARDAIDQGLQAEGDLERRYRLILRTLDQAPRQELLLRYANQAAEGGYDREQALYLQARLALVRGDTARGLTLARQWADTAGDGPLLQLLLNTRHAPQALHQLQEDLSNQSPSALALLFDERLLLHERSLLQIALDQGGLERLSLLYRPLLENSKTAQDLHGYLGPVMVQREALDQGTVHLRAEAAGLSPEQAARARTELTLGRVQLSRGKVQAARAAFARYLQQANDPAELQSRAWDVITAWMLYGQPQQAEAFLRGAMADPARGALLLTPTVDLLLLRGDRDGALELLRGGPLAPLFHADQGADASVVDLLLAARQLARHGFPGEAAGILRLAAQRRGENLSLLLALVELDREQADTWAQKFTQGAQSNGQLEHEADQQLARAWMQAQRWDKAKPLILKLVASGQRDITLPALEMAGALARSQGDPGFLEQAAKADLEQREDRYEALLDQALTFQRYDFMPQAAQRYALARAMSPHASPNALAQLLLLSGQGDQARQVREQHYTRVGVRLDQLILHGHYLTQGPHPEQASQWWSDLASRWPAAPEILLGQARLALIQGEEAQARSHLDSYLTRAGTTPWALEQVLELLAQQQSWQLTLDYAGRAPAQEQDRRLPQMTPRSYLYLGTAAYHAGKRQQALQALDTYTALAPDEVYAHLEASQALSTARSSGVPEADTLRDARTYAERALKLSPASPAPWLRRGQLRLLQGDAQGAIEDFDAYLTKGGYQHSQALGDIGRWLLQANQLPAARRYLLRLARHPGLGGDDGLVDALVAYREAGRPSEGLAFLREEFPALASAPWYSQALLSQVADLVAEAGNLDRAVTLYEAGLARFPDSAWLQNNYAWLLARTGRDLDRAEQLAWLAQAHPEISSRLRGVYLDTLAWIHRRQNKLEQSLGEQRRALYMIQGSPGDAKALYTHLAEIYTALGRKQEASRAQHRASLHDPEQAPFPSPF